MGMHNLSTRISCSRISVLLPLLLVITMGLPTGSAIPTWYNVGNYVIYDCEVEWMRTSTVGDANTRWKLNMT
ncbi:MAG: hypothetical protein ACUVTL_06575 [Thermoproteota archaeon]